MNRAVTQGSRNDSFPVSCTGFQSHLTSVFKNHAPHNQEAAPHTLLHKWFQAGAVLASFDSFERLPIRLGFLR